MDPRRFAYVIATVFLAALLTGIIVALGSMASLCFIAPSNRCFSISRDTLTALSIAAKLWWLSALIVAFLVATISEIRGVAPWWSILIAAAVSMLLVTAIDHVPADEIALFVLVGSPVLFVGVQLSRLISRLFDRRAI
jgi:hypothetical protein